MSSQHTCERCGVVIAADAPSGHCAKCLIELGFVAAGVPPASEPGGSRRGPTRDISSTLEHSHVAPEGGTLCQPAAETPGATRFGDYELLEEIAHGGMGVVYKARQISLNRIVAVKMIRADRLAREDDIRRFRTEAQAAAQLQHPNIVAIHEVGEVDGQHFYSMDYVAGKSLAQIAREKPLSPKEAAGYVQKIADAIHYAHERGILHRDLKPSNVLIDENDEPKVADFGLAKLMAGDSEMTMSGTVMGSPSYMPPEQASGRTREVSVRSDVYSLGAILYDVLCGRPPFRAETTMETLRQVVEMEPVLPRVLNPRAPRDLETVILKCLQKESTKRYGSAEELSAELARFLHGEPIQARPVSKPEKVWRWCKRKPALAAALAACIFILLVGLAGVLSQWRRAEDNARTARATVTKLELLAAESLFEKDKAAEALAYLARILRREPGNRVAAERILSALSYRAFCLPLARVTHAAEITAAQFSPDGEYVLTASKDKTARVWEASSGRLIMELAHTKNVLTAQFSPDGKFVLTASGDQRARLWDGREGRLISEFQQDAAVISATFSSDGRRIVTGAADGSVRVWDINSSEVVIGPYDCKSPVEWAELDPEGKMLVAVWFGTRDIGGRTRLIEVESGRQIAEFPGSAVRPGNRPRIGPVFNWNTRHMLIADRSDKGAGTWLLHAEPSRLASITPRKVVHGLALSPDGLLAATVSQDNTAQLWDSQTGEKVGEPMRHEHWAHAVLFSPDGSMVVTGSEDNTARLWDTATAKALSEPLQHHSPLYQVGFSQDGTKLVSVCADASVWVWSIRPRQLIGNALQHAAEVRKAVFSPDGLRAATAEFLAGGVRLWSTVEAQALIGVLAFSQGLQSQQRQDINFSPDGRWVAATLMQGGVLQLWDTKMAAGEPVTFGHNTNNVASVDFSPDARYVVTAGGDTNALVWELATGEVVVRLPHKDNSHFARFSKDGSWVLTASYDNTAQLWDWRAGKARFPSPLRHHDKVVCADISPTGEWLATLSVDKTARVWDARTGRLRFSLTHTDEPYHYNVIQASPDGRLLVTAAGSMAQVWDAISGQPVSMPLKHRARVNSVRFSPDSKRVVTACTDGAARIWDAESGHLVGEPYQHAERVNYAEFSPDGRWLMAASEDATARVWEVPQASRIDDRLADLAEAFAGQRLFEGDNTDLVRFDQFAELRQGILNSSDTNAATKLGKWLFDLKEQRSLSPLSAISVDDYVNRRIADNTLLSLEEARRASPGNIRAAAMGAFVQLKNGSGLQRDKDRADWQTARALSLKPNHADVWWARAQVCERIGKQEEMWTAMEQAARLNASNAHFWNAWGGLLESTNRIGEALAAYSNAVAIAGPWKGRDALPAAAWRKQSTLLRRSGRLAEAGKANLRAVNVPERGEGMSGGLIDLSVAYNRNLSLLELPDDDFTALRPGRVALGGVEFDLRGAVQFSAGVPAWDTIPEVVPEIPVEQKCHTLSFLHVARVFRPLEDGIAVGEYRIRYQDGEEDRFPIKYGHHVRSFSSAFDGAGLFDAKSKVAWSGKTPGERPIRLFMSTWENQRRDVAVESVNFISNSNRVMLCLFAITAETPTEQ